MHFLLPPYWVGRPGKSVSVLDFAHLGSSVSLRTYCRAGAMLSAYGMTRLGSSLSVLDFVHLGSTLSLRSFLRVGSALSIYGMTRLGSSLQPPWRPNAASWKAAGQTVH